MKRYLTVVPYAGNYESVHNMALEGALEQMFSDHATGCHVNEDLQAYAYDAMNWHNVFIDYAKDYMENFGLWLGLDLTFVEVNSPRYYNFDSDLLMTTISEESLLKAYATTPKATLDAVAKERHTSRDGFISFFNPDVSAWGPVTEWEAQQICTLLTALAIDTRGEFGSWEEYELMEDSISNGVLDDMLYKHCPKAERLLKIRDYLETRSQREEATV